MAKFRTANLFGAYCITHETLRVLSHKYNNLSSKKLNKVNNFEISWPSEAFSHILFFKIFRTNLLLIHTTGMKRKNFKCIRKRHKSVES